MILGTVHLLAFAPSPSVGGGQNFSDDFKWGAIIFLSNLKGGGQNFLVRCSYKGMLKRKEMHHFYLEKLKIFRGDTRSSKTTSIFNQKFEGCPNVI